jgi:hypothetical protein
MASGKAASSPALEPLAEFFAVVLNYRIPIFFICGCIEVISWLQVLVKLPASLASLA